VEYSSDTYWKDKLVGSKRRGEFAGYQNIAPKNNQKLLNEGHIFLFSRLVGGFTFKTRQFRELFSVMMNEC